MVNTEEIVKLYTEGNLSTCKIARLYSISTSSVQYHLKKGNVRLRSNRENSKKYEVNESYFEKIDSCEKAYFLGLIYADGNINKSLNTACISLIKEDSYILNYYLNKIYKNRQLTVIKEKITGSKEQRKLSITNIKIVADLVKLGVVPNKSKVLEFPKLDKEYVSSFILGYFDGDGCFSTSKTIKGNCLLNMVGSKSFINSLQDILVLEIELKKTKLAEHNNVYYMRYSGRNNIKKIYNYLYNSEVFCLQRKKLKIEQFINN